MKQKSDSQRQVLLSFSMSASVGEIAWLRKLHLLAYDTFMYTPPLNAQQNDARCGDTQTGRQIQPIDSDYEFTK